MGPDNRRRTTTVALRRIPRDLPPPLDDGLPTRPVHGYSFEKSFYWGGIMNAAARVTKAKFSGRRTCIDIFTANGINREVETGVLSWGSALLSMHADDRFDRYIFCDIDPVATDTLARRVEALFSGEGTVVYPVALGSETLGAEIEQMKQEVVTGAKVIVLTGDANEAARIIPLLLPAFEAVRYSVALIDPPSAVFEWESLVALTLLERRMDVVSLFPEDMDIERNLRGYLAEPVGAGKLDRYFGTVQWRELGEDPHVTRRGRALRDLYKNRMRSELGYAHIANRDRAVRNSAELEIYKLTFASKHKLGLELWNSVNKYNPSGQMEFPIF